MDETTQNAATATTETQPDKSAATTTTEAKFTQADLDRIMGETRQKATEATRKKLLAELETEDFEADKELLKAARKRKADEQTEVEKAQVAIAKLEKERDEAKTLLETERQQRVIDRRDSAIKAKASNAHDLDAVLEWANRPANAELLKATVGEDGAVIDAKVEAVVAAARKNAPYLFKAAGPGSPSNAGGRTPQGERPKVQTSGKL